MSKKDMTDNLELSIAITGLGMSMLYGELFNNYVLGFGMGLAVFGSIICVIQYNILKDKYMGDNNG